VLALAVAAPPASAAKPCWRQLQDDWVDDGVIQSIYPLNCYREAIAHVPNDLAQYTGIIDDITAARQRAARAKVRRLAGVNSQPQALDRPGEPNRALFAKGFDRLSPDNADSFPLPLLILGGLALLMIAAGGAGLLTRRFRTPKVPG